MTVKALNKTKIVKKRMLKVRRFQSDRVQKVKVLLFPANTRSQAGGSPRVSITV